MLKKIIVEFPVSWLRNEQDGDRNSEFIMNVLLALSKYNIPITLIKLPFGCDHAMRYPEKGTIIFSYHSYGNVKNVWRLKEAPLTPFYSIDKSGYSGWSNFKNIISFDSDKSLDYFENLKNCFIKSNNSKYKQGDDFEEGITDFIFFPLQVESDPVARFNRFNLFDLIDYVSNKAMESKEKIIFKVHPLSTTDVVKKYLFKLKEKNTFITIVDNVNIHSLIKNAKAVVSVNSGVGLEALLYGKPVYICGECEWSEIGNYVYKMSCLDEIFTNNYRTMNESQIAKLKNLICDYWVANNDFKAISNRLDNCIKEFDPNFGISSDSEYVDIIAQSFLELNSKIGDLERRIAEKSFEVEYLKRKNKFVLKDYLFLIFSKFLKMVGN